MNETLTNELCQYLGQLMYQHEHEFDWIKRDALAEKIIAANKLLDNEIIWYKKAVEHLKTIK